MWETLTADELAFKARCRNFAETHILPYRETYDRENCFPQKVHDAAYEAGLMNVAFPVTYGGQGLSLKTLAVGAEELAAVCAPTAFTMGFSYGAMRPLWLFGSDEQKRHFLGRLIRERRYASIGLTEAHASGSNLLALGTRAIRTAQGYRIHGSKCMVGNGCRSDDFVILARAIVDGMDRGLSFFVVPRGESVHVSPNTDKIGFRCVTTPTVTFDGALIPEFNRIGEWGQGEEILLPTLDYIRYGGTAVILGTIIGALREAFPWISERRVYPDDLLLHKGHVQMALASLFLRVRHVRTVLWDLATKLDQGKACSLEASIGKLEASRLALDATAELVQLMGWRGIDNDYSIQKRYRDARVTTIFEGTSEVQLLSIYRHLEQSLKTDANL